MRTVEDTVFPDGIPETMTFADFGRLLGISRAYAGTLAKSRPDMLVTYPGTKHPRVRRELYLEFVGKQKK